jgi:replication factor A1
MQVNKELLYTKISDLKTKHEFEEEIKKVQEESDFLFDEETSAFLIVDQLGRNKENICKISELENNMECTIIGKVTNIGKMRSFNRKNGSNGRVINLEIKDETGIGNLVLWDKDTELVKNKTINNGDFVRVINGYVKDGYNGLELNVGRYSLIEIIGEEETPPLIYKNEIREKNALKGEIKAVKPTHAFFKYTGEFGFVSKIILKADEKEYEFTVWDEKVKELQGFKIGDIIEIKGFDIRKKNAENEYHLNGKCKIEKI